jgi:hypothetical protein
MQFTENVHANWQEEYWIIMSACPHTARETLERIRELQWRFLEHPPYRPDFHLFGPLRNHVGGRCFADDKEVETEVWKWLR